MTNFNHGDKASYKNIKGHVDRTVTHGGRDGKASAAHPQIRFVTNSGKAMYLDPKDIKK